MPLLLLFSIGIFGSVAGAETVKKEIKASYSETITDPKILSDPSKINFINEDEKRDYLDALAKGYTVVSRTVAKFPFIVKNNNEIWLTAEQEKDYKAGKPVKAGDVTIQGASSDIQYLTLSQSSTNIYEPTKGDTYKCHYLFKGYHQWSTNGYGRDYVTMGWAGSTPIIGSLWTAKNVTGGSISTYKKQTFPNSGVAWGMYNKQYNLSGTFQVEVGKTTNSGTMGDVAYTYWHQTTNYELSFVVSVPPAITLSTSGTDTASKEPSSHMHYYY